MSSELVAARLHGLNSIWIRAHRVAIRVMLIMIPFAFIACRQISGCGPTPCPDPAEGGTFHAQVRRFSCSASAPVHADSDSATANIPDKLEICVPFPDGPVPPEIEAALAQSDPKAKSAGWASYFKFCGGVSVAMEMDELNNVKLVESTNPCKFSDGTTMQAEFPTHFYWSGGPDEWKSGEITLTLHADDRTTPMPYPLSVWFPDCPGYDDTEKTVEVKIHFYKALPIMGGGGVERGSSATFTVKIDGIPDSDILACKWKSTQQDPRPGSDANGYVPDRTWSGIIVAPTVISCEAKVKCGTTTIDVDFGTTTVVPIPRNWMLDPPSSPLEDNDPDWPRDAIDAAPGSPYPWLCEEGYPLGRSRDAESRTGSTFTPNPAGRDPSPAPWYDVSAYTVQPVEDDGPNDGVWYIFAINLRVNKETVINKYIKADGPAPPGETLNWYNANNDSDYFSVDLYIQAIKAHEALGIAPTLNGALAGHYAQLLYAEASLPDLFVVLEPQISGNFDNLLSIAEYAIATTNEAIAATAGDHAVVHGNFGYLLPPSERNQVPTHLKRHWPLTDWSNKCECPVTIDP